MKPLLIRTKIRPYESLSSLLHRLTQDNVYDRTGWIYRLIDLSGGFRRHYDMLDDRSVIRNLATINNCSENDILNTTAHRFTKYLSDQKSDFLDPYAKNFVLCSRTQYCPLCLKDSGYHKIYWRLLPVSICIKHKVILQNVCPICHSPVKVDWVLSNKCYCGGDLLSADPEYVTSVEMIHHQSFIQNLIGINESEDFKIVPGNYNSPAAGLSPPDFFKLLRIIYELILNKLPESSTFLRIGDTNLKQNDILTAKRYISNFSNFMLIHMAASILLDWPQRFYDFLGDYCKIDRSKRWETGVERYFGGLREALFAKLDDEKFDYIYNAYCNYLNEHWTGGYLGNTKVLEVIESQRIELKHITLEKTAEILGCDRRDIVSKLINRKIIKAVVLKTSSKKRYIIDAESVYSLKRKADMMITESDVAERLNIGVRNLKSLVRSGLLPHARHKFWCSVNTSFFDPKGVEKFEKEFLSAKRRKVVDNKQEGYLSALDAVEAISCTGANTGRLLQLVRQGVFKPIIWREGKGLSKLLFKEKELEKYRMEKMIERNLKRDWNKTMHELQNNDTAMDLNNEFKSSSSS